VEIEGEGYSRQVEKVEKSELNSGILCLHFHLWGKEIENKIEWRGWR